MQAGLAEDIRYSIRMLAKSPGTTLAAMTALAFGIGFNAATYSSADVLVFRPVLMPEIDRTFAIYGYTQGQQDLMRPASPAEYLRWRETLSQAGSLTATRAWRANLTGSGDPETVEGQRVTASFFDTVAMRPMLGRVFSEREDSPGADRVVVLSHALWERRFGADTAVVGRTVQLDGANHEVIGVMPEHFRYPVPVELWVPLALDSNEKAEAGNFYLHVAGRLKPGASLEALNAQIPAVTASMRRDFGGRYADTRHRAEPLKNVISGDLTRDYTMVILGCVGFLLVIACTNVANLQMARMMDRAKELAIRSALGASRLRLIRQVMVESFLLAAGGMLLGLVVAVWSIDMIKTSMPPEVMRYLPGWQRMGLNLHVLLWTMGATCTAGLLAGLAPAIWMTYGPASRGMRESERGATGSRRRQRISGVLVTSEVVLSLILLVGASLMARSLNRIGQLPAGIPTEKLLTFRVALPISRYEDDAAIRRFQDDLSAKIRELPGVTSAGHTLYLPYGDNRATTALAVEGVDYGNRPRPVTLRQTMDPGFLNAFGLRLLKGRAISQSDGQETQKVAVINERLATLHFPDRDPIGQRIELNGELLRVVGVVEDVIHNYSDRTPIPTVYLSAAQAPQRSADFVVRAAGDPLALMPAIRAAVAALDPIQPVFHPRTMRKLVTDSITGIIYTAGMMSVLGLTALLLSAVGVYSLIAWAVGQRTREIGVRLALGATPPEVLWTVLKRTTSFVALGLAMGMVGSFFVARMLSGLVFGIAPVDLVTFTGVPAILLLTAIIASVAPARRALRTDPVKALQYE